ncbi:unnamed protein product [Lactuca virosa]|uniref:Uncharacterized protein n=1 Tax=Lactuca virosa TaxID=75947 RepID=A0AAU9NS02_9ASTR|nr:unnamed protein product [Lactuca virosa]
MKDERSRCSASAAIDNLNRSPRLTLSATSPCQQPHLAGNLRSSDLMLASLCRRPKSRYIDPSSQTLEELALFSGPHKILPKIGLAHPTN